MKKYGAVDANQREIVAALRELGASVASLAPMGSGVPDLLVGFRGQTYLFEIKDGSKPPSKRRLTMAEKEWHEQWRGGNVYVVCSVTDAMQILGLA